jgi:hypothetical protein
MTIAQQLKIKDFPFIIKDKNGKVIYSERRDGFWCKREYDTNGNQIYFEDSNGYWYKCEYDANGKEIYLEDSDGLIKNNRPKIVELTLDEIAAKSAEITDNIAIGFVEWLTKIEAYPCINRELNGLWVMHPQDPKNYTPKELFQEYLKTKENDKSK